MCDYSAICAVSGLPITSSQQVVGFELEPYIWEAYKHRYVPASWPVFGEYDYSGGIKDHNLSPNCALIHKEVWDNAHSYWNYHNRKNGPNFFNLNHLLEETNKKFKQEEYFRSIHEKEDNPDNPNKRYVYTIKDCMYYIMRDMFTQTDEGLVFRTILDSKNHNVTNVPESYCFLERSAFTEILMDKILENKEQENIQDIIYKLTCLYSGQMITGKQIAPCLQPNVEQYPTYKQRIKLLRFTSGLATKLQKQLNN